MIAYIIGRILLTEAALLVLPLLVTVLYGESPVPFLIPILLLALCGGAMGWKKPKSTALYARYAEEHGNLLVPSNYVTAGGFRLGVWMSNLRAARKTRPDSFQVTPEHVKRL